MFGPNRPQLNQILDVDGLPLPPRRTARSGVMATDHDEIEYGCDETLPGNCPCDDDDCSEHPYKHICTGDEFHAGRHRCCCGRNWGVS